MSPPGSAILTVDHDGSVSAIAFSPDSTRFASAGDSQQVRVRAVRTGPALDIPVSALLSTAGGPTQNADVSSLAFSPTGAQLAVAVSDRVVVCSAGDGTIMWGGAVQAQSSVNFVAFTPDGKQVVAVTDTLVAVLDAATGAAHPAAGSGRRCVSPSIRPSSTWI